MLVAICEQCFIEEQNICPQVYYKLSDVKVAYGPRRQAGAGSKVTNATICSSSTANKGALESLLYSSIPLQAQSTSFCRS
jgi:hypothetical protein